MYRRAVDVDFGHSKVRTRKHAWERVCEGELRLHGHCQHVTLTYVRYIGNSFMLTDSPRGEELGRVCGLQGGWWHKYLPSSAWFIVCLQVRVHFTV